MVDQGYVIAIGFLAYWAGVLTGWIKWRRT